MKKIFTLITILFFTSLTTTAQQVSAYQYGAYQPGLMNVRDLATVTSPGLILIDYNYWLSSDGFYDQNGDRLTLDRLDTQVSGYINVPVIYYASDWKILGGRYSVSLAPMYMSAGARINVHNLTDRQEFVVSPNVGGFGDLIFSPLTLGWSFNDNMDFSFLYMAYAPTGRYEIGADDNIGKGYWTHQFQAPFYYYLMEKATALFVMPTFETNGQVKGSDVRPGSRFSLDYGISQYVTSWLELEILNGHTWQISDDKGDDVWWNGTKLEGRDHTNTVSFGAGAWPWEGRLNVRAKYVMDYGVKQRFKTNFLSLSVIFIPNVLTGKNK
jgi:hypothetical protein